MSLSWIFSTAEAYNKIYGPVPDIVETQGAHLLTRPSTPLIHDQRAPSNAPDFVEKLDIRLSSLRILDNVRRNKYGPEVANEYLYRFTPEEARLEHEQRCERILREISEENDWWDTEEEKKDLTAKQALEAERVEPNPDLREEDKPPLYKQHEPIQKKRGREVPVSLASNASLEPSTSHTLALALTTQESNPRRASSSRESDRTKRVKLYGEEQDTKYNVEYGRPKQLRFFF